jgi:hypothetical protein
MKIVICITLILLSSVLSNHIRHRNHEKIADKNSESPSIMSDVYIRKSVPVSAVAGAETRFKEKEVEKEINSEILRSPTLITPVMKDSIGYGNRYNVEHRVAQKGGQQVNNKQAFSTVYQSHKDYYDKDKKYYVLDNNFAEEENYLLNGFSEAIQKQVKWDKDLVDVRDYKEGNGKISLDDAPVPRFSPDAARTNLNMGSIVDTNPKSNFKASSDPYSEMFGGRHYK